MKRISSFFYCLLWILISNTANAYELATHGVLTEQAYEKSSLSADKALLKSFGLDLGVNPFGEIYYEMSEVGVVQRKQDGFEKGKMPDDGVGFLSIPGWLMRGAIREDDHRTRRFIWPLTSCSISAPNPQYGGLTDRPKNHFFDPWTDAPLETWFGIDLGERAPKWGLGSVEPFDVPQEEEAAHENHYTLFDAMEAMYRALTAHTSNGSRTIVPDASGGARAPSTAEEEEAARKAYWATTFRSLGDVVHLIQDMAQPQHTRNDPHSGVCGPWAQDYFTGHASVYESYVEERAIGGTFAVPGGGKIATEPLNYADYPIPAFSDYASYFSTRHLDGSILSSRGLADYSNRGFFTAGTNLGSNRYAYPSDNLADFTKVSETTDWSGGTLRNGSSYTLLYGTVNDSLQGTSEVAALTTEGLWDQFLVARGERSQYTLTKKNYDHMANLLIPRAVAYGAGFLDFFFRGRVKILDTDLDESGQLVITLENASGPNNVFRNGVFELFYDRKDGFRVPLAIVSGAQLGSGGIGDGDDWEIVTTYPMDVDQSRGDPLVLVFRGEIGAEIAVAGRVFGLISPVYLADHDNNGGGQGYIDVYTQYGDRIAQYPSGVSEQSTAHIAVYNGDRYTTGWKGYPAILDNGAAFAEIPAAGDGFISANSRGIYVTSNDWPSEYLTRITHFDHFGNHIYDLNTGEWGSHRVAVNESILVAGWWDLFQIFDLSGNFITFNGGDLGYIDSIFLTQDRIFVLDTSYDSPGIKVYDLNGNLLQ